MGAERVMVVVGASGGASSSEGSWSKRSSRRGSEVGWQVGGKKQLRFTGGV